MAERIVLEPALEVEDILIEADDNNSYSVKKKISDWSSAIPVIKINDYVLPMDACMALTVNVRLGQLPTFTMTVNDTENNIKNALKDEIDKCVIFLGYEEVYIKFNGLIKTMQYSKEDTLFLSGIMYVEPLYTRKQILYKDKTIEEIITSICEETKLGYYVFDNDDLTYKPEVHICPNLNQITNIADIIGKYTDNLWTIDTFGYLYMGTVDSILAEPIDNYLFEAKQRKFWPLPGKPIIITIGKQHYKEDKVMHPLTGIRDEIVEEEIQAANVRIETNFSKTATDFENNYTLFTDEGTTKEIDKIPEIGNKQTLKENTFYGFTDLKFPSRSERINKMLCGNYIVIELEHLYPEIVPFTNINLERWIKTGAGDAAPDAQYRLDSEHSGKHFVFGYEYNFWRNTYAQQPANKITQTLYCI